LILTLNDLPEKILTRISKVHFIIKRANCELTNPVYIQVGGSSKPKSSEGSLEKKDSKFRTHKSRIQIKFYLCFVEIIKKGNFNIEYFPQLIYKKKLLFRIIPYIIKM